MDHTAAINQSKLSDNSVFHYYVGPAPYHKQVILLFNRKTRQTIVQCSFQQLSKVDDNIPDIPLKMLPKITSESIDICNSHPDYWVNDNLQENQITNSYDLRSNDNLSPVPILVLLPI